MMLDPFRDYDRWKLMSPEDEADEESRRIEREERLADKADEMYDRWKDGD